MRTLSAEKASYGVKTFLAVEIASESTLNKRLPQAGYDQRNQQRKQSQFEQ